MNDRTCLHCALARAMRAEASALVARGIVLTMGRSEPVWLPVSGQRLYRALRSLLREARAAADPGPVKLAVLDLDGKSHVEVTLTIAAGRRTRVLRRAFPRFVPGTLAGGFVEGLLVR